MINAETTSIGVGCFNLDVDMARACGWTEDDIKMTWEQLHSVYLAKSKEVALRVGHTRQCSDCECWTVPVGPCHLCTQDEVRHV